MQDPGLDRHEWTSRFEAIEPDLHEDPPEALPELLRLVEEMLVERGYDLDDAVVLGGDDPEVVRTFTAARDTALRCQAGQAGAGDIGNAIEGLVAVYEYVNAERPAP